MRTLVFSLAFTSIAGFALAQAPNAAGRQQFETRCSRCHGGDATGGEAGPNIVDQIDARNDADLAAFLRTGRPASGMPAFDLPAQDMTALTAYLRTLIPVPSGDPPPEVRKKVQTTDGRTLEGQVLNEGMTDLQLRHRRQPHSSAAQSRRRSLPRGDLANRLAHLSRRPER